MTNAKDQATQTLPSFLPSGVEVTNEIEARITRHWAHMKTFRRDSHWQYELGFRECARWIEGRSSETTPERARSATEGDWVVETNNDKITGLTFDEAEKLFAKQKFGIMYKAIGNRLDQDTEPATYGSQLQTEPGSVEALKEHFYPDPPNNPKVMHFYKLWKESKAEVKSLRHEMMLQTSAVEMANRYQVALEKIEENCSCGEGHDIAREALK